MIAVMRRSWDQVSLYLPVLLMGFLALGTLWLVRNAPIPLAPVQEKPPRHEPDYYMKGFSVKTFDGTGRLQSEVQGEIAHHYPDTDTLEIDQARLRSVSAEGRITLATANRALSNADGSEVQLFGNAVVTRQAMRTADGKILPRMEFQGEFLHAWTTNEHVRSHLPVTLIRGRDQFTADSMEYDNLDQLLQLNGRVRGVLMPAAPKSR